MWPRGSGRPDLWLAKCTPPYLSSLCPHLYSLAWLPNWEICQEIISVRARPPNPLSSISPVTSFSLSTFPMAILMIAQNCSTWRIKNSDMPFCGQIFYLSSLFILNSLPWNMFFQHHCPSVLLFICSFSSQLKVNLYKYPKLSCSFVLCHHSHLTKPKH